MPVLAVPNKGSAWPKGTILVEQDSANLLPIDMIGGVRDGYSLIGVVNPGTADGILKLILIVDEEIAGHVNRRVKCCEEEGISIRPKVPLHVEKILRQLGSELNARGGGDVTLSHAATITGNEGLLKILGIDCSVPDGSHYDSAGLID